VSVRGGRKINEMTHPEHRPVLEMVRLLRAFEGQLAVQRIAIAGFAFCAINLLPFAGAIGGIYVGANLKLGNVVAGAVLSVGSGSLAIWLSRSSPWRAILAKRLSTYEDPNPTGFSELLTQHHKYADACYALRRARFAPLYGARVGAPPDDAPELTTRIGVQEPAAWRQSTSDDDRLRRLASVLAAAGIRARVAGLDAFPDGRVEPRHEIAAVRRRGVNEHELASSGRGDT
jgi:hypothetical protein